MILAAGFGTRLRPLTLELPKPLVWVGDRPAIAHIAERLVAAGITEIVVNTHHRAEAFSPDLLARVPGRLSIVTEPEILGTGGGLANAAPLLGEGDVVVWNGDILTPLDVTALLAAAARETGADSKRQKDEPPRGGPFAKLPGAGSPEGATPSIRGATPSKKGATLAIVPRPRGQGTVGIDAGGFERAIYMGVHLDFLGQLVLRDGTVHPTAFILGDDDLFPLLEYGRRMDWPTRLLSARVPSPMTGPREFFLKADLE